MGCRHGECATGPVQRDRGDHGHWHISSKDVEANKKLFLALGGRLFMPGGNPLMMFPGVYINLVLGTEKGDGSTEGSVINHDIAGWPELHALGASDEIWDR